MEIPLRSLMTLQYGPCLCPAPEGRLDQIGSEKDLATVTQQDIVENPHHLKFTEMKSLNIPSVRTDFAYIVITGSIVYNAKIDPSTALLKETILPHLLLQLVVSDKNKKMPSGLRTLLQPTSPQNLLNI